MKRTATLTLICILISISAWSQCSPNESSLLFDGTSAYIDVATNNNLDPTTGITVEAWIKATSWGINSWTNTIVGKDGWFVGEEGYVLRAGANGTLSFNLAGDSLGIPVSWKEVLSSAGAMTTNTWYHVAGTFDGTALKLYINGNLVGTTLFTGLIFPANDYFLNIGRMGDEDQAQTRYWAGYIDEVRIWDHARTGAELSANMNQQLDTSTVTGLIAYYRFNENTGFVANDMGSGNNEGSLIGTSWSADVPFGAVPAVPTINYNGTYLYSNAPSGNQWYLDGLPISGGTSQAILPTVNGNYTVTVTNLNGCSATSDPYPMTTLGLNNPVKADGLNIWPNPAHDKLNIRLSSHAGKSEWNLFNAMGQKVMGNACQFDADNLMSISLESLPPGIYEIKIRDDAQEYRRQILIK